jgi:hypothetical protein
MKLRHITLGAAIVAGLLATSVTAASARPVHLFAVLLGGNETGGGDADGNGTATVILDDDSNKICFGILVDNIGNPNAAHIHEANAGVNGDIVVPLVAPSNGDPGSSSGCVGIGANLADRIARNPSHFYVNVHTGRFPNGAIRGQLF